MSSLQENVRNHRRRTGMSQEQLAEAAGLSVQVVRKAEQGGNLQVETIHMLARALGTTTSSLFATEAPEPLQINDGDGPKLSELRRALMPPVGLREVIVEAELAPALSAIQCDIDDSHSLYHADRYDSVAKRLPGILRDAEAAVTLAEGDEARQQAIVVRASAFLLAGKYLTQVRRYDMAYHALSLGIRDAREAGEEAHRRHGCRRHGLAPPPAGPLRRGRAAGYRDGRGDRTAYLRRHGRRTRALGRAAPACRLRRDAEQPP